MNGKHIPKLTLSIESITPEIARDMIEKTNGILESMHIENRKTSASLIRRYAGAYRRGEWEIADPIMVSDLGAVIEGQHRLLAVIDSGLTISFVVIKGYSHNSTLTVLGSGKTRTTADVFSMARKSNSDIRAAVCQWLYRADKGDRMGPPRVPPTPRLLTEVGAANEHEIDLSLEAVPESIKNVISRSLMVFCHMQFAARDRDLANRFMTALALGENLISSDPVYRLREYLIKTKTSRDLNLRPTIAIALTRKTWNQIRMNRPASKNFRFARNENYPEVM